MTDRRTTSLVMYMVGWNAHEKARTFDEIRAGVQLLGVGHRNSTNEVVAWSYPSSAVVTFDGGSVGRVEFNYGRLFTGELDYIEPVTVAYQLTDGSFWTKDGHQVEPIPDRPE